MKMSILNTRNVGNWFSNFGENKNFAGRFIRESPRYIYVGREPATVIVGAILVGQIARDVYYRYLQRLLLYMLRSRDEFV